MRNHLKTILGIQVSKSFTNLEKVGDLLYFDGPLMSVYKDEFNCSYIYDWAESDEEVNRWLIYQIDEYLLWDYISGKATHLQLLNSPAKDIIFVVDIGINNEFKSCFVVSPQNIPNEYIPQSETYFDEEDSRNLDRIIFNFKFEEKKNKYTQRKFNILQEAKQHDSELINLHFNSKSRKVGFGRIYSSVLAEVLSDFHSLSEATALSLFDEKGKKIEEGSIIRRKKGELKEIKELGEFEYLYSKAASFSVFLRPIKGNRTLFTQDFSASELIAQRIFKLFNSSKDIGQLQEMGDELSGEMLTSYNSLMKVIKEEDISLTIQYANPLSSITLEDRFDLKLSEKIISNLEILESEQKDEQMVQGNFKALDSINSTFKFEDLDEYVYSGKFSNLLKESIYYFNLKDLYSATIEIIKTKKSGEKKLKEKATMISCIKKEI